MPRTPLTRSARSLQIFLRLLGTTSLSALIFVAAPHSWIAGIHSWLGLGEFPGTPVVWYLARSTSAFYALLGGLLWLLSFDPARHRVVLTYLGAALCFFGAMLLVVDRVEGLPLLWTLWEGPVVIGFGTTILILIRRT